MNWTGEKLEVAIELLKESSSVDSAYLDRLSQLLGGVVTLSSLRHAFARYNLGRPQQYLNLNRVIEKSAKDIELMTRARHNGGQGRSQKAAFAQIEDRLGVELEDMDEHLRGQMRQATLQIIEENGARASLLREARSRQALEERLAALTSTFVKMVGVMKQPCGVVQMRPPTRRSGARATLVAALCDIHFGKYWKDKEGVVKCSQKVLRERMMEVVQEISTALSSDRRLDQLVLWFGGDIFESPLGNMRKNQQSRMDLIGKAVIEEARETIVNMIASLMERHPSVSVRVCLTGGNHDRLTEEKEYSSEDFFMYMFGQILHSDLTRLGVQDVMVLPPVASLEIDEVEFLLLHGHRNRLPNETAVRRLIENHSATNHRKMIVQGHYHSTRVLSGRKWECVTVPSICGCDDFVQYDLNQYSEAGFCMFVACDGKARMIGPILFNA